MISAREPGRRSVGRAVTAAILAIIAILCIIAGVLYVTETAGSLSPAFLGTGSRLANPAGHHVLRAAGSFVLAAIFLIAAGSAYAYKPRSEAARSEEDSPADRY